MHSHIYYTAVSEKGARKQNEDNLMVGLEHPFFDTDEAVFFRGDADTDTVRVFCVCDGIGGSSMGELAALSALDGICQTFRTASPVCDLTRLLLHAAENAQRRVTGIYRELRRSGGTTLAAVAVRGNAYASVNIGDSPIFLARSGEAGLRELSFRHNLAHERQAEGLPFAPEDEYFLMRYLGKPDDTAREMAHVTGGTLTDGDTLFLCSDGISGAFSGEELERAIRNGDDLSVLGKRAAGRADSDNCTAISITIRTA